MRRSRPVLYSAYRGDEFLCVGTAREVARATGLSEYSVRWRSTPSVRRRMSGSRGGIMVTRLDDEEGEGE